jgi:hypothetical protein
MAIRRTQIAVTPAAGGAGVATANAVTPDIVDGIIRGVYLEYTDSPPAGTTDVTIVEKSQDPAVSVLTVTNAATDRWFFPLAQAQNQAAADITNQGAPLAVSDYLKVTIAQANNGDGVTATILWEER